MQKYVYWDENIYQILLISTIDMIFDIYFNIFIIIGQNISIPKNCMPLILHMWYWCIIINVLYNTELLHTHKYAIYLSYFFLSADSLSQIRINI